MTISALSNSSNYMIAQRRSNFATSWQSLVDALRSGNATAAQQAYSDITQSDSPLPGGQNGPWGRLLAAIGSELQTGNLSGAQQAIGWSERPAPKAHRHHHHHDGQGATAQQPATNSSASSAASVIQITELVSVTFTLDISVG